MGTNFQPTLPRVATVNTQTLYSWDDGTPFTGFILIELIPPLGYPEVFFGSIYPSLPLPIYQRLPINQGYVNGNLGVFLNIDLVPPTSQYRAFYYDSTSTQIAGPTIDFTVTTQAAFTPPILPLPRQVTLGPVVPPD